MATEDTDVLVIGGGIHGVGVAQAAAAAGYSVLLLEQRALAHGTSSRSSKLIHGGLRYLERAEFSLVRESLRERELLLRLAPSLVKRQKFYLPVYPRTARRPWALRTGLSIYAVLAGLSERVRFRTVPRSEWETLDGLRLDGLQKVFQYWDAQTDDAALTRAVMKSAQTLGARLLCPAEFIHAEIRDQRCHLEYRVDGNIKQCISRVLVNAAGPWAREVLHRVTPAVPNFAVDNVQGAHLELPGEVTRGCYYMETLQDKRAVFVMPWKQHTLVGTTEHLFDGDPERVEPLPAEQEYLLNVYRYYFPHRSTAVLNTWAGLRVLPAANGVAFRRSRETQLPLDNDQQPRVLSIFGGKLTGYRATADKVMDILRRTLPQQTVVASTTELELAP